MVSTASDLDNTVLLQRSDPLGLLYTLEVSMAKLSSMLLHRGTAPSVQISILVNRCKMMLPSLYLHGHQAIQCWNKLWLVVVSSCHLEHRLTL